MWVLSNPTEFHPIALQTNYCFDMCGQCHLSCTEEFKNFSFLFVPNPEVQNGSSWEGQKDAKLLNCLCKSDTLSHNSVTELWQHTLFNTVCPLESYQNVPTDKEQNRKKKDITQISNFPPPVYRTTILRSLHKAAKKSKP